METKNPVANARALQCQFLTNRGYFQAAATAESPHGKSVLRPKKNWDALVLEIGRQRLCRRADQPFSTRWSPPLWLLPFCPRAPLCTADRDVCRRKSC